MTNHSKKVNSFEKFSYYEHAYLKKERRLKVALFSHDISVVLTPPMNKKKNR